MQFMQRRIKNPLARGAADDTQAGAIVKDFEEAERMLLRLIECTKTWRDAWNDIFAYQERLTMELYGLYNPVHGSSNDYIPKHEPKDTPEEQRARVSNFHQALKRLRSDMADEIDAVDQRIINPATIAKDSMQHIKKTIKKRTDRHSDYEKLKGKYDSLLKKASRSEKDRAALAKCESDLAAAEQESEAADERIVSSVPPLTQAVYSLLPPLLSFQIMIQNTLLGHYYTELHAYCEQEGFPSPAPPTTDVVSTWKADFQPIQQHVETELQMIAGGKEARKPMGESSQPNSSLSSRASNLLPPRSKPNYGASNRGHSPARSDTSNERRQAPPPPPAEPPGPALPSRPGPPAINKRNKPQAPPPPSSHPEFEPISRVRSAPSQNPHGRLTPSDSGRSSPSASELSSQDYFQIKRTATSTSMTSGTHSPYSQGHLTPPTGRLPNAGGRTPPGGVVTPGGSSLTPDLMREMAARKGIATPPDLKAIAEKKKKPPPPPPPKRQFVIALYDFEGQDGELSFKEDDRIKVVKKTASRNDWWDGELRGVKGSFPANYCKDA